MSRWRSASIAATLVAVLMALAGCASQTPVAQSGSAAASTAPARPTELFVSGATSLKAAFTRLAPAFEKANNAKLTFNFGASGVLQKQIEGGAPADVFASASPKQVDALIAGGLVSVDTTRTFASNDLVIFVPKGNPAGITGPNDVSEAKKVTTGDPATAPHGAKAQEWLTNLKLWDSLKPRFVFAENAAQTLDYVARGEVDAGIGFASEVKGKDTVEIVYTVPKGEIKAIRYVIAPLKASKNAPLAQAFIDYVMSAEGQKVLQDAYFLPPPAK